MNVDNTRKRLGELLIEHGLVTPEQVREAQAIEEKTGDKLGAILVKLGYLTELDLMAVLELQLGIPFVNIAQTPVEAKVAQLIPESLATRYKVLPIGIRSDKLVLAMSDPMNVFVIDDIRISTGMDIYPVLATETDIMLGIKQYLGVKESLDSLMEDLGPEVEQIEEEQEEIEEVIEEGPIVRLVNSMIAQAVASGASDIHVEPMAKEVVVRYRIDGVLHKAMSSPRRTQAALLSRLKIMSNLDIAEKRLPQDGRFAVKVEGKEIDIRVSSLPTVHGEKIVMRILDKSEGLRPLDKLGMLPHMLETFEKLIGEPYGMLLMTGPTGSGKTTVLYSALQELNNEETNIITVEDPVEYTIGGINQVNVNVKAGLTFASGLRSILRQDPDVVMVGEIRDAETASIAIGAALTGHFVLSTLHTNSAAATISRLMDMGIEPFLISASIVGVMAQRLVRRICPNCKEEYQVSPILAEQLHLEHDTRFYRGRGCRFCNNTGYQGRMPVQELLVYNQEIKDLILARASADEIEKVAIKAGMETLWMDGLAKAKAGLTSLEEVMTVVSMH
ncbi:MAG TPA: ATPase, T2SS/T4P/T4SS family [Desulfobacteria bacterium]|nr:ATPase, T2SS/T4P/T4SS family [Desulfobacteria bacterium]